LCSYAASSVRKRNDRAVYFTVRGTEEAWKRHGEEDVALERDAALAPVLAAERDIAPVTLRKPTQCSRQPKQQSSEVGERAPARGETHAAACRRAQ
jgi:hypothetical protein